MRFWTAVMNTQTGSLSERAWAWNTPTLKLNFQIAFYNKNDFSVSPLPSTPIIAGFWKSPIEFTFEGFWGNNQRDEGREFSSLAYGFECGPEGNMVQLFVNKGDEIWLGLSTDIWMGHWANLSDAIMAGYAMNTRNIEVLDIYSVKVY